MKKILTSAVILGSLIASDVMAAGFEFKSKDFSAKTFGRVHWDLGFFDEDKASYDDGTNLRRARLGVKGDIFQDWSYKLEVDFGQDEVNLKSAYIAYEGLDIFDVKMGHHKTPQSLENITSSNDITFLARSSVTSAFAKGEMVGASVYNSGKNYTWRVGMFDDDASISNKDEEAKRYAARFTYAPIMNKDQVLHMGASYSYIDPQAHSDTFKFSSRAENSVQHHKTVSTGSIKDVENVGIAGLELAGVMGPLSLQGEYVMTHVERDGAEDLSFDGYYVQASYFLTGETRPYKLTKFGRITPKQDFDLEKGTWGAFELAARYSHVNLNDENVLGGEMDNMTLGVNWHTTKHSRLMLNYIISDTDENAKDPNDEMQAILLRAQLDF